MSRNDRKKWIAALLAVLILLLLLLFLWRTGLLERLRDAQALRDYLSEQAPWSHLIFFGLQLCSVIIAPIPSNLVAATGGAVFGFWQGFLMTILAVTIGSCTTFWLARTLCKNFADRVIRKKLPEHYLELLDRKRDSFLILTFLFPFFPDDLLCIMAGVTDIPFRRFFFIVLLAPALGTGGSQRLRQFPVLLLRQKSAGDHSLRHSLCAGPGLRRPGEPGSDSIPEKKKIIRYFFP